MKWFTMNIKKILYILLFIVASVHSQAQKPFQLNGQKILRNENLDFFVVKLQTEHFIKFNTKDKIPSFIKEQLPFINDSSIANPDEYYNATDAVMNDRLPWRQIQYGAISNDVLIVYYKKGGVASNDIILLVSFVENKVGDVWISHSYCENINSVSSVLDCININFKDKAIESQILDY